MVCIPCIVIPFFLWIFHRFLRPFILKFWDPWKKPISCAADTTTSSSNSTKTSTPPSKDAPVSAAETTPQPVSNKKDD
ncbi:UPF0729 protein AGAP000931 [Octopus sinensis]|uniref:UPF0729 protein AGAP000931 n=1 Tax=Octopus sinensis TaxID=2607531 RepID=A0A6P7TLY5_9MOLL|nr:UPF0729 protein AGAP000931 [Octopus sinensis]